MFDWFKKQRQKQCGHHDAYWKFAGYHTGYGNSFSRVIDTVYIRQRATCPDCGEKLFKSVAAPPKLSQLFFDNFKDCMTEDPTVIANAAKPKPSTRPQDLPDGAYTNKQQG